MQSVAVAGPAVRKTDGSRQRLIKEIVILSLSKDL
jgi:hypothetical protein